jgi:tRNA (adenine37-N6)-methyltransferase
MTLRGENMRLSYKRLLCLVLPAVACLACAQAESGPSGTGGSEMNWTGSIAITFHPIGILHSPFKTEKGTPLYPSPEGGTKATVVVFPEYEKGLQDLEGFSHVWLIGYFDRARPWKHLVLPHRDTKEHGLFATRCPARPNSIGLSVVKLTGVKGNLVEVEGVDFLDNTPILDIKPYLSQDVVTGFKSGWIETATKADKKTAEENDRFVK